MASHGFKVVRANFVHPQGNPKMGGVSKTKKKRMQRARTLAFARPGAWVFLTKLGTPLGSKLNRRGYTGFGPCFHLPGFHVGYRFFEPPQKNTGNPAMPWSCRESVWPESSAPQQAANPLPRFSAQLCQPPEATTARKSWPGQRHLCSYCGSCTTLNPWLKPLFVGIYKGIIISGALRWCRYVLLKLPGKWKQAYSPFKGNRRP